MDSYDWAQRFAGLLERSLVFCGNQALKEECKAAIHIYRTGIDPLQHKAPLKTLIKCAAQQAIADSKDPYEAILEAIAERTQDCCQYFTDDQDIYQDVRDWLIAEAQQEAE